MNTIYHWTGLFVFWLAAFFAAAWVALDGIPLLWSAFLKSPLVRRTYLYQWYAYRKIRTRLQQREVNLDTLLWIRHQMTKRKKWMYHIYYIQIFNLVEQAIKIETCP